MMTTQPGLNALPGLFADFGELSRLRAEAREDQAKALPEAAAQFEAVFLDMMLKHMRQATFGDALLGDGHTRLYRDFYDHQIAIELSQSGGIGLADLITQQLGKEAARQGQAGDGALVLNPAQDQPADDSEDSAASAAKTGQASAPTPVNFDSPEQFVQAVWPHATRAGEALGVDPRLLVAQAALETGWGRSIIRQADGNSSFNLFGIKAHGEWSGDRVAVQSLEYEGGVVERRRSQFRAYADIGESFNDYVALVRGQPRYQEALGKSADPAAYMRSLQNAGYATDPHYADKVLAVMAHAAIRTADTAGV